MALFDFLKKDFNAIIEGKDNSNNTRLKIAYLEVPSNASEIDDYFSKYILVSAPEGAKKKLTSPVAKVNSAIASCRGLVLGKESSLIRCALENPEIIYLKDRRIFVREGKNDYDIKDLEDAMSIKSDMINNCDYQMIFKKYSGSMIPSK